MRILANIQAEAVTDYVTDTNMTTVASLLETTDLNIFFDCNKDKLDEMDYLSIKSVAEKYPERFSIRTYSCDITFIEWLNENKIKWQDMYPVTTLRELKILKNMNAASYTIADSLLFQMDEVVKIIDNAEIPIFLYPYIRIPPKEVKYSDPVVYSWIAPKGMAAIAKKYPQVGIEINPFLNESATSAYISAYSTGIWSGSLASFLNAELPTVPSFPLSFLPEEFTLTRLNCGRKCDCGVCHYCRAQFNEIDLYLKKAELFKKKE